MRGGNNADNHRPTTVVWSKPMDDDSSSASLSSARKPSEVSLMPTTTSDPAAGERGRNSKLSATSKVYQTNEPSANGCRANEPRRSKSRVRTYLKRCKDAIIGAQMQIGSQQDQTQSNASLDEIRPTAKSSTSSWYVNELFSNANRNEVNESSNASTSTNDDATRNYGEIECVVAAEETAPPPLCEEQSIESATEIDENTFEFVVSVLVFTFFTITFYWYVFMAVLVQHAVSIHCTANDLVAANE